MYKGYITINFDDCEIDDVEFACASLEDYIKEIEADHPTATSFVISLTGWKG